MFRISLNSHFTRELILILPKNINIKMMDDISIPMPPLGGDNTPETSVPDSPDKIPKSPVSEIKQKWRKCLINERSTFMTNPLWKSKLTEHVEALHERTYCVDLYNSKRKCNCTCMSDIEFTDELMVGVVKDLFKFALLDFESAHLLVTSWIRYANLLQGIYQRQQDINKSYILPGTPNTMVCRNAIASLIGYGKTAWTRLLDHTRKGKELEHGNTNQPGHNINAQSQQLMHAFFQEISLLALPRATLVVRGIVARAKEEDEGSDADADDIIEEHVKDGDVDVIDLPPSFSKRSLCKRFVMDYVGWSVGWHSNGKQYKNKIPNKPNLEPVPSWGAFRSFWKANYPKMRIQKSREDICGHCYVFANSFRHLKRKKERNDDESSNGSQNSNESDDDPEKIVDAEKYNNEELILKAAKHVEMAKTQRDLYNEKKRLAKETPNEVRTYTIDYAQNTYMPHLGDEQPGETYYYSPVNVYTLGIVNTGMVPMKLYAHVYYEDEGKKGGNNVVSCMYRQLFHDGFLAGDRKHVPEMNFVFDNCGGQNKNRMVLRFLLYVIQKGACDIANALFLVKGHTKNDCDRMFNLMKLEYRKKNSYVPSDVEERLGAHKDIKLMRARVTHFHDWDAYFEKYMTVPKGVKTMHVFSVHADDLDNLQLSEYWGAPVTKQLLLRPAYRGKSWAEETTERNRPDPMNPPGMRDIKYMELYDKWRHMIPIEKRKEYKDFDVPPPVTIRKKVKENKKVAADTRAARSATDSIILPGSQAPKKKAKKQAKPKSDKGII